MKRRPEAAALLSGLPLAAILWAARLPPALGGSFPRAFGWRVAAAFTAFARSRAGRVVLPAAAYLGLLLGAAAVIWELVALARRFSLIRRRAWPMAARLLAAAGAAAVLAWLARAAVGAGLDLLQNAVFPPESMSVLEPAASSALLVGAAWLALRALSSGCSWLWSSSRWQAAGGRRTAGWAAALLAAALSLRIVAAVFFDAGRSSLEEAARLPPPPSGWRAVTVLTAADGKPAQEPLELALGEPGSTDYSPARLAAAESYVRRGPSVYRRAALRFLYSGYAFELDAEGVRRALELGVALRDPMARALALDSLACAPATDDSLRRLDLLADESRYVIGPQAAAKLAVAYARFGHLAAGRAWKQAAESGPDGLPEGLLELPGRGGPVGRVDGRLDGWPGSRVGLYCRSDAFSPYAIGPAQLVAAAPVGKDGRFSFGDLAPGSYFLAVAKDARRAPRLAGHRGDIELGAQSGTRSKVIGLSVVGMTRN